MSVCYKCKKSYPEHFLQWINLPIDKHIQIIWTGRGRDPRQEEEKMELVCDECIKTYTTSSSLSS